MAEIEFGGCPVHALDGKGRLTVPARYRDFLLATFEGQMVVTKNPDRCLTLFPKPVWQRFRAKLVALPESRNWLKRLYIGSESPVQIDNSSRVLLPPELREWAGLERDVIFMGTGNRFELWDKVRYRALEDQSLEQAHKSEQLDDLYSE